MALTVGTAISIRGPQGTPGISFLVGSGAPTGTGTEGQGYLDGVAGELYKYTNGQWTDLRTIIGPMGLNGINGSFFTGTGAPTTATYNGTGQAIYINTVGELWTYTSQAQGWVDSGENLTGPAGATGQAGARGTMIFHDNKPFDPANFPNAAVGDMFFRDDQGTYAFITST